MRTAAERVTSSEKRNTLLPFIGYLCFLYLAWTIVWVYGVYPWATKNSGAATLTYALISVTFRLLILVLIYGLVCSLWRQC
jgi:hypothetical protein